MKKGRKTIFRRVFYEEDLEPAEAEIAETLDVHLPQRRLDKNQRRMTGRNPRKLIGLNKGCFIFTITTKTIKYSQLLFLSWNKPWCTRLAGDKGFNGEVFG